MEELGGLNFGNMIIGHRHLISSKRFNQNLLNFALVGEKAHQCEECGKCFGRRDHLTVHYKSVHLGEKVWQK